MYEKLVDCSYAKTRQLAGYATLLHNWIYEHFSSIDMRCVVEEPRCRMYKPEKVTSVVVVRLQLDTITLPCIRFSLYDEHRKECPFEWISLFFGYLRLGSWRQFHFPELCSMDMCK